MSSNSIRILRIGMPAMVAALGACWAGGARAQLAQTWVSEASGNDANACTLAAPCKTFTGALAKTASGGEIGVMDRGNYEPVSINSKSVVLNGRGTQATIVTTTPVNAVSVVNPPGEKVTIRDLELIGGGNGFNGVSMLGAGSLALDNVHIHGFTTNGVIVSPGTGTANINIADSSIHDNGSGGVQIVPPSLGDANATLTRVLLFNNARGLRIEDGVTATVKDSVASHNSGNGFIAVGSLAGQRGGGVLNLEGCVSAYNGAAGIFSGTGASVRISNVHVTGNPNGLVTTGGQILSSGNNTVIGNGTNGAPTSTPGQI